MVAQVKVKCTRCGRVFIRYIYKQHPMIHKFRHHRGHKGAGLSPMDSCYICNGPVVQVS